MSITLSCGHKVTDFDEEQVISVKDYARDWSRAVSYRSVCKECLEMYKNEDAILYTEQAEMDWLNGSDE